MTDASSCLPLTTCSHVSPTSTFESLDPASVIKEQTLCHVNIILNMGLPSKGPYIVLLVYLS